MGSTNGPRAGGRTIQAKGRVTPLVALVGIGLALASSACASSSAAPTRPEPAVSATVAVTTTAPPTTATEATTVRSGDTLDIPALAARMAATTTGDEAWIPIMAELRVRSWLATRYPGRYAMTDVYEADWAAGHPAALEAELLDLDVYFDEALPTLTSVVETRTLGELVELEVELMATDALIRQNADDAVVSSRPGGPARGLFVLGPSGPGGSWRIHSILELDPAESAEPAEPAEAAPTDDGGSTP